MAWLLYTVLIPAFASFSWAVATAGVANGSSALGYAAVFGRSLAGSDVTQRMNGFM